MTEQNASGEKPEVQVGRNEPCPCGSGKKYKRCHGIDAAPKMTMPKLDWSKTGAGAMSGAGGMPGAGMMPPGFDPSQLDPQMMQQFSSALQKLPKGQMQRLQSIMQKAMAGKDITQEAQEFERTLPPDFQEMMKNFKMPGMEGMGMGQEMGAPDIETTASPADPAADMTPDKARQIIEEAVAAGKLSREQADELLKA